MFEKIKNKKLVEKQVKINNKTKRVPLRRKMYKLEINHNNMT